MTDPAVMPEPTPDEELLEAAAETDLLEQFPLQSLLGPFTRFDLAAGEFP